MTDDYGGASNRSEGQQAESLCPLPPVAMDSPGGCERGLMPYRHVQLSGAKNNHVLRPAPR